MGGLHHEGVLVVDAESPQTPVEQTLRHELLVGEPKLDSAGGDVRPELGHSSGELVDGAGVVEGQATDLAHAPATLALGPEQHCDLRHRPGADGQGSELMYVYVSNLQRLGSA